MYSIDIVLEYTVFLLGLRRFPELCRSLQTENTLIDSMISKSTVHGEKMNYDVVIIGGGPSGLSTAIKLKQEAERIQREINVCVIEKSERIGSHILSGNVFNSRSLDELIPNWKDKKAPVEYFVEQEQVYYMTKKHSFRIPKILQPNQFDNKGNYIISLSSLTRWLGTEAEELGVDIFTGISIDQLVLNENNQLSGVYMKDDDGLYIEGKYICLAEGVNGVFSKDIISHYNLRDKNKKDKFALGIKEIWEIEPFSHGKVDNYLGYPMFRQLSDKVYGGGYIYSLPPNKLLVGYMVGLDYENTYISPYEEFQLYKQHPIISEKLKGGKRIEFGAKCITEGGVYSMPKPIFPGGCLVGESARLVDPFKIKGAHLAIESGILAGKAIASELSSTSPNPLLSIYENELYNSTIYKEMYRGKTSRQLYTKNFSLAAFYTGTIDRIYGWIYNYIYKYHKLPSSLPPIYTREDWEYTKPAEKCTNNRDYQTYNDINTFSRSSSLALSSLKYDENNSTHIHIYDDNNIESNYNTYKGMEERMCPAEVYEYRKDESDSNITTLYIHPSNCLHCRTCTAKACGGNIKWTIPKHGNGPNYIDM
ncbi:hypothetical protein WA158_006672 [Blastocystis sp. Blastoise]